MQKVARLKKLSISLIAISLGVWACQSEQARQTPVATPVQAVDWAAIDTFFPLLDATLYDDPSGLDKAPSRVLPNALGLYFQYGKNEEDEHFEAIGHIVLDQQMMALFLRTYDDDYPVIWMYIYNRYKQTFHDGQYLLNWAFEEDGLSAGQWSWFADTDKDNRLEWFAVKRGTAVSDTLMQADNFVPDTTVQTWDGQYWVNEAEL
jgi:hypothetical protein